MAVFCPPVSPSHFPARPLCLTPLPHHTHTPTPTEDRICGTIDIEKALTEGVKAFEAGLLARANRGILYVDEVNLLDDGLVDVVLDSGAPHPAAAAAMWGCGCGCGYGYGCGCVYGRVLVDVVLDSGGCVVGGSVGTAEGAAVALELSVELSNAATSRSAHLHSPPPCILDSLPTPSASPSPLPASTCLPVQPRAGRTRWSARASRVCTPPRSS